MEQLTLPSPSQEAADFGRFTARFWDKHSTGALDWVKDRIADVLDARARQGNLFAAPEQQLVAPQLVEFPAPAEPAATHLATVLSPSQISTYLDCQTRWYYKHALGLPDYKSGALAIGIAFHEAIAENFRQKIETKTDLDPLGVVALFRNAWAEQMEIARLQPDEDPEQLRQTGETCTRLYIEEAAPFIDPVAVELEVAGEIAGVQVRGKVDILDVHGIIIDAKTAAKSPHCIDQGYRRQIATYVQITPGATGEARLDTVTKARTAKMVPQSFTVDAADRAHVETLFPLVQEGMRSGLYMPNRGSNLCSRRHCPYWERCEDEYGGKIGERAR